MTKRYKVSRINESGAEEWKCKGCDRWYLVDQMPKRNIPNGTVYTEKYCAICLNLKKSNCHSRLHPSKAARQRNYDKVKEWRKANPEKLLEQSRRQDLNRKKRRFERTLQTE